MSQTNDRRPNRTSLKILLLGLIFLSIAVLLQYSIPGVAILSSAPLSRRFSKIIPWTTKTVSQASPSVAARMSTRTPVWFFSHGGPNIMEDLSHPAHAELKKIGREITQEVKPKAVVVFSAHWQGGPSTIEVNTATSQGLIYDFYGFPAHYYEFQYPNEGSPELAEKVMGLLDQAGIKAEGVRRGLDHGVWAGFMVAFDPKINPLSVPLVQVSLYDTDDPNQHYALGRAIKALRDQNIQIITSGMSVHNLRDMWAASRSPGPMPYAVSFDAALKEAVEMPAEKRQEAMAALLKRSDARKAHPSFEHLLPIFVAAGAAGDDAGKQVWTMPEGSMAWAQYRFG